MTSLFFRLSLAVRNLRLRMAVFEDGVGGQISVPALVLALGPLHRSWQDRSRKDKRHDIIKFANILWYAKALEQV